MKKFFVSLVMLLNTSAACVFAQSSLIAALSHEGEITMFYGASALLQAHEAATHGDVITLSSGTFSAVDIEKAITLRGAGFESDVENNLYPTTIAGEFNINKMGGITTGKVLIEGIYSNDRILGHNLPETTFMKCRLSRINFSSSTPSDGVTFIHCKIVSSSVTHIPTLFVNSFICTPSTCNGQGIEYVNCILYYSGDDRIDTKGNFVLKNCIVVLAGQENSHSYFTSSSSAYKCIAVDDSGNVWRDLSNASVYTGVNYSDIFSTFTGAYSDTESFELTDEAKAKYLGLDGTEIGIYGGSLPFDPRTSAPQITKFNVATKSTVDGKLSVDIEVKGVE